VLGLTLQSSRRLCLKRFAPAESRLWAQRLLTPRNYNTAARIHATLRGRTLRKFDTIIMLAVEYMQIYDNTPLMRPILITHPAGSVS